MAPPITALTLSEKPANCISARQAEILSRQIFTPESQYRAGVLYRYASRKDIIVLIISTVCAVASGAAQPIMTVLFAGLQRTFQRYYFDSSEQNRETFNGELSRYVLYFVYLAIGQFFVVYISTAGFIHTGERISAKIREQYLFSCMRQNIGFFDKTGAGEITNRISADINLVQDGISERIPVTIAACAMFITAYIIGFVNYWKLALILLSITVALVSNIAIGSSFIFKNSKASLESYSQGGNHAGEAISSIRNVVAFGAQDRLAAHYEQYLRRAEFYGYRVKCTTAIMVAVTMFIIFASYGLGFWQGSRFLAEGMISLSQLLMTMMSIIIGTFQLGSSVPNIHAFTTALAAAAKVFNVIDRDSPLDPIEETGSRLNDIKGDIKFQGVYHVYPSRPESFVLKGVTLSFSPGKTTALVGSSGCGKSTIVGLIERFYEPVEGFIYVDGQEISTLNLRWLRQQISFVGQEPVLFGTTIFENIRYGLIGSKFENCTRERQRDLIIQAAKMALAHGFICSLPDMYETHIGERGTLLSGGQKQRIAIARAIVSDPKILLLDEATSALDTKSEGEVQAALENAAQGRTTIIIAHRLATIKNSHNIVVMSSGRVIEQGTHDELLKKKEAYYKMVLSQDITDIQRSDPGESQTQEEKSSIYSHYSDSRLKNKSLAQADGNPYPGVVPTEQPTVGIQNEKQETGQTTNYTTWALVKLVLYFNLPEKRIIIIALAFTIICGCGNPTSNFLFARQVSLLSQPLTTWTEDNVKKASDFWSLMCLVLSCVQLLAFLGQGVIFARCSERLVYRVRDSAFRTILRQDIAFFDQKENTTGALTSFLSTEATHLASLSGVTLGTLLMLTTAMISALAVSFSVGWKLSLVCLPTIPVLLGCGFLRVWMLAHFQRRSKAAWVGSASFASEAISAIRTVASLTLETEILKLYRNLLVQQQRLNVTSILKSTILYSASHSVLFLCFALAFWYGGTLVAEHEYDLFQFYLCFTSIIFGAQSTSTFFSFAPDMSKAFHAAQELKALLDRKPCMDSHQGIGQHVSTVEGGIVFRDVDFGYPSRPKQLVLRGLSFTVNPCQYVALVGASGCGKSTVIALLERFYDPLAGSILIDGKEVSSLNLHDYRSFIALVDQEPRLYQGTIRENILLGSSKEDVSNAEIESVCRSANIHDFIMSLPEGLQTMVGQNGILLSGGQKQRIAIARALIRNPKILLLDEATSALDSESEHAVQKALDEAAKGRTTIVVAHRLSTIQKADIIYILDRGHVVEAGNHSGLMARNGRYAELINQQSLTLRD